MRMFFQWLSWHAEDIKGGIKVLFILGGLFFLVRGFPILLESNRRAQLKGETFGVVVEKKIIERIHESEIGGRVKVQGYEVKYRYSINEERREKNEYLDKVRFTTKERARLSQLREGDTVVVRFDLEDFTKVKMMLRETR